MENEWTREIARLQSRLEALKTVEKEVSDAYLRIRSLVGAWDTAYGGDDRFIVTENKIRNLQAEANRNMTELCEARGEIAALKARIKELEGALRRFADFILEECDDWPLAHEAARNAKKVLNG